MSRWSTTSSSCTRRPLWSRPRPTLRPPPSTPHRRRRWPRSTQRQHSHRHQLPLPCPCQHRPHRVQPRLHRRPPSLSCRLRRQSQPAIRHRHQHQHQRQRLSRLRLLRRVRPQPQPRLRLQPRHLPRRKHQRQRRQRRRLRCPKQQPPSRRLAQPCPPGFRVIGLRASQFRRCPPGANNLNWKIMESGTANDRTQRAATCPPRQAG